MYKAYKFRIYPNKQQEELINKIDKTLSKQTEADKSEHEYG